METLNPVFQLKSYLIRPRFASFASEGFDVMTAKGQPLFYVRAKRYIPKSELRFYPAADHGNAVLTIKARRLFSNQLAVIDPAEDIEIGRLEPSGVGTQVYDAEDAEVCLITESTPDLEPFKEGDTGTIMVVHCKSFWKGLHQCLRVTFHPHESYAMDGRLTLPAVMWHFARTMNDGNTAFTKTFYGFTEAKVTANAGATLRQNNA